MHEQLKLENQLCFRLYSASRLITQAYTPFLTRLGLTYPQYLVLLVLWEKDGLPVNDLAHRLHLETNTVTPLLQRMERQGLVSRLHSEKDRRQVLVSLTAKGHELEEAASVIPAGIASRMVCDSVKPETVPDLFVKLDDIIRTLEQ